MKIWIVDAFTDKPFSGNPAGVMIVDDFPSDQECSQIAAEVNLSETAFVKPLAENHFHIRWFTPKVEVKLCGHATLASSHILWQEKLATSNIITLESLSGPLRVLKNEFGITLDFPLQKIEKEISVTFFEKALACKVLHAVKAVDDVIVELASEETVRELSVPADKIMMLNCRGLIVTALAKYKYDFISRFFAPKEGINEDPVTGSAHCKLADYWQHKLNKTCFLAYQASKRGGELQLEIQKDRVHITGQAVTISKGEWLV